MKKVLCVFVTVIMLLSCMTACNFHSTVNDGFGNTQAKSLPKVEEMLAFLCAGDTESAIQILHPDVQGNAEHAMRQNSDYLLDHKVQKVETITRSVYTSKGTAGDIQQETAYFKVFLEHDDVIAVSAVHLTNDTGEGFSFFQVVLGVY